MAWRTARVPLSHAFSVRRAPPPYGLPPPLRRSTPFAPSAPRGGARWSGRHRLSPFRASTRCRPSVESPTAILPDAVKCVLLSSRVAGTTRISLRRFTDAAALPEARRLATVTPPQEAPPFALLIRSRRPVGQDLPGVVPQAALRGRRLRTTEIKQRESTPNHQDKEDADQKAEGHSADWPPLSLSSADGTTLIQRPVCFMPERNQTGSLRQPSRQETCHAGCELRSPGRGRPPVIFAFEARKEAGASKTKFCCSWTWRRENDAPG